MRGQSDILHKGERGRAEGAENREKEEKSLRKSREGEVLRIRKLGTHGHHQVGRADDYNPRCREEKSLSHELKKSSQTNEKTGPDHRGTSARKGS